MIALGFTNLVFMACVIYFALERRRAFYKSHQFWLALIGLLVSLYITFLYFPVDFTGGPYLAP